RSFCAKFRLLRGWNSWKRIPRLNHKTVFPESPNKGQKVKRGQPDPPDVFRKRSAVRSYAKRACHDENDACCRGLPATSRNVAWIAARLSLATTTIRRTFGSCERIWATRESASWGGA